MTGSIFIDGKEYISAVRVSKKIGYASDYIGQLCRAKKIDARLIGKTWYVDFDALVEHKRNRKLGKKKNIHASVVENNILKPVEVNITQLEVEKLPEIYEPNLVNSIAITYEKDDRPRLPELSKSRTLDNVVVTIPKYPAPQLPSRHSFLRRYAVITTSVVVVAIIWTMGNLESGRISFVPIQNAYKNISLAIKSENESASIASAIDWIKNFFGIQSGAENEFAKATSNEGSDSNMGIVVVPDANNHEGAIAKIKRAFSDNVNVKFDKAGDSGTITPVFREDGDFENYAFVIVPVDESKPSNN